MPTTFSLEILRREVVDVAGEFLGILADFSVDITTGNVVAILVALESDLDPSLMPWSIIDGLLSIPVEEVDKIGTKVQLKR